MLTARRCTKLGSPGCMGKIKEWEDSLFRATSVRSSGQSPATRVHPHHGSNRRVASVPATQLMPGGHPNRSGRSQGPTCHTRKKMFYSVGSNDPMPSHRSRLAEGRGFFCLCIPLRSAAGQASALLWETAAASSALTPAAVHRPAGVTPALNFCSGVLTSASGSSSRVTSILGISNSTLMAGTTRRSAWRSY
jgi:hypothetical protein